jgi:hypothetical protein
LKGAGELLAEALTAVAQAGGTAVVQAVSTDAWAAFRQRVARLFGHGNTQREETELERLDRTAAVLETVGSSEELARQEASWQARFEILLEGLDEREQELVAADLRTLIAHIQQAQPRGDMISGNTFHGPTAVQVGSNNRQENRFGSEA